MHEDCFVPRNDAAFLAMTSAFLRKAGDAIPRNEDCFPAKRDRLFLAMTSAFLESGTGYSLQ